MFRVDKVVYVEATTLMQLTENVNHLIKDGAHLLGGPVSYNGMIVQAVAYPVL